LNLLTQTIPTALAIFPIKFNVLEVGKKISSKNKLRSYQNKNPEVKCQIRTLFIHYSLLQMTLLMCAVTLFTTLHRNTQEWKQALNLTQHHNEHILTQPHLNYTHQNTEHKHTENFTLNETIVPRQRRQI